MILGLVGAGNMATALVRGWESAGTGPDAIVVSDADAARAARLAEDAGARLAASNRELAEHSDVIALAMKPAALEPVAEEIRATVAERRLPVVSILGAVTTGRIEEVFGPGTAVLRFMPNVAAEVGRGTFCFSPGTALDGATQQSLLDLFGPLGEMVPVEERLMETATAISGCGPAFFALVVESLVDAGVREGLTAEQAAALAVGTMAGTGELIRERGGDAVAVRRQVTSPGGVTAAGLAALERGGVRTAFAAAVRAVVERAAAAQGGERSR